MPEYFIVYEVTALGKVYMRLDECGCPVWNKNFDSGLPMEKPIAGLWRQMLSNREPLSTFGIDRV